MRFEQTTIAQLLEDSGEAARFVPSSLASRGSAFRALHT